MSIYKFPKTKIEAEKLLVSAREFTKLIEAEQQIIKQNFPLLNGLDFDQIKFLSDIWTKWWGIHQIQLREDGRLDLFNQGQIFVLPSDLNFLPIAFGDVHGRFEIQSGYRLSFPYTTHTFKMDKDFKYTSFDGFPEMIGEVSFNKDFILSLKDLPYEVGYRLSIINCPYLYDPNGIQPFANRYSEQRGNVRTHRFHLDNIHVHAPLIGDRCTPTPISKLFSVFGDLDKFAKAADWDFVRVEKGSFGYKGLIVKSKFEKALKECGLQLPKFVEGYEYV